jgi:histidine triad (HIT) family protein
VVATSSPVPAAVPACPFCAIGAHEIDAHIVFEDDEAIAFLDRSPLFHGHTLVVPREHVVTLADLDAARVGPFWRRVQHISRELPALLDAQGTFVANNNVVSQSVAHLHVHVVPRRRGDGLRGFFWPRTKYAEGQADELARRLRVGFSGFTDS